MSARPAFRIADRCVRPTVKGKRRPSSNAIPRQSGGRQLSTVESQLFERLAREEAPRWRSRIQARLGPALRARWDADDVCQEALAALVLAVRENVVQLDDAVSARRLFATFLRHAVGHVVERETAQRRDTRRQEHLDADLLPTRSRNPESLASSLDIVTWLCCTLGPECAAVAALRGRHLSQREIARQLGVPRGRVTVKLAAIRRSLCEVC